MLHFDILGAWNSMFRTVLDVSQVFLMGGSRGREAEIRVRNEPSAMAHYI